MKYHKDATSQEMRVVDFPAYIVDEEIMEIAFKDNHLDIVLIKTKHLNMYQLDISSEVSDEAVIVSKRACTIETRSIFGLPREYLIYFEAVKLFMENQQTKGHRLLIPRNHENKVLVGYDPLLHEFYVYDILANRIIRSFHLTNPNYNEEKIIQEELKQQQNRLNEDAAANTTDDTNTSNKKTKKAKSKDECACET